MTDRDTVTFEASGPNALKRIKTQLSAFGNEASDLDSVESIRVTMDWGHPSHESALTVDDADTEPAPASPAEPDEPDEPTDGDDENTIMAKRAGSVEEETPIPLQQAHTLNHAVLTALVQMDHAGETPANRSEVAAWMRDEMRIDIGDGRVGSALSRLCSSSRYNLADKSYDISGDPERLAYTPNRSGEAEVERLAPFDINVSNKLTALDESAAEDTAAGEESGG